LNIRNEQIEKLQNENRERPMWKIMQSKSKEPTAMFLIKKSSNIFLLSELACAKCGFNPFLELLRFLKEDMCVWSV